MQTETNKTNSEEPNEEAVIVKESDGEESKQKSQSVDEILTEIINTHKITEEIQTEHGPEDIIDPGNDTPTEQNEHVNAPIQEPDTSSDQNDATPEPHDLDGAAEVTAPATQTKEEIGISKIFEAIQKITQSQTDLSGEPATGKIFEAIQKMTQSHTDIPGQSAQTQKSIPNSTGGIIEDAKIEQAPEETIDTEDTAVEETSAEPTDVGEIAENAQTEQVPEETIDTEDTAVEETSAEATDDGEIIEDAQVEQIPEEIIEPEDTAVEETSAEATDVDEAAEDAQAEQVPEETIDPEDAAVEEASAEATDVDEAAEDAQAEQVPEETIDPEDAAVEEASAEATDVDEAAEDAQVEQVPEETIDPEDAAVEEASAEATNDGEIIEDAQAEQVPEETIDTEDTAVEETSAEATDAGEIVEDAQAEQIPEETIDPRDTVGEEQNEVEESLMQEPNISSDQDDTTANSNDTNSIDETLAPAPEKGEEAEIDKLQENAQEKAQSHADLPGQPITEEISTPGIISSLLEICAKDIMQNQVTWASPDDSLQQAIAQMQQSDAGYIMIGQNGALEGIVSKSDTTRTMSPYLQPIFAKWRRPLDDATLKIRIKWIMSRPVHTIKPQTPLATIMEHMSQFRGRCLPVMDEEGNVQGLVTAFDIFRALLKSNSNTCSTEEAPPELAKTASSTETT